MEYSIVVLDNSDHSRNGDYVPSRWEAQIDCTVLISNTKLAQNQESAIGIITLAGQQPKVLLTPTNEDLKIQASLHNVKQQGKIHFKNGLSVAYLALKHRKNSHARQRITVFVASPVEEDEATLVKFAKTLKKNSVAVDLINIGQMDAQHVQKLEKFIQTVNQGDNSHFISIEPGLGRLEDKLIGTPFVGASDMGGNFGDEGAGNAGGQDVGAINNQFAEWGGINPQEDPELAEIMRQSLLTNAEEEKRRQELKSNEDENKPQQEQKMDVEQENKNSKKDDNQEEELIRRAQEITINDKDQKKEEEDQNVKNPEFMNELLDMIPGIDKDNEEIKQALQNKDNKDNNDKKDDNDKDNNKQN